MLLIGISGKARTGKDTVARHLVKQYGFHQLAFADPIVDGLIEMLGIPAEYRSTKKEEQIPGFPFSYRIAAQTLGTEWGRGLCPSIWIRVMEKRISEFSDGMDRIVISDVRFENEASWIRDLGFLWHVERQDAPEARPHISENGVKPLPGEPTIRNDDDLSWVEQQVDGLFDDILGLR